MAPQHLGWKTEIAIATVFMILTALWSSYARADYDGTFHLEPHAEEVPSRDQLCYPQHIPNKEKETE